MRSLLLLLLFVFGVAASSLAQPRPAAPPAPAPAAQPPAATPPPAQPLPPAESFTYEPAGRRDPFLNLLGGGTEKGPTARRVDGPAGMSVGEISVRGIMQSRGAYIAMIQGPDKKTYIVRQGDKLLDGTVKTITAQEVIVLQDVNDPLSLVKTREIHKPLRTTEDAKE